MDTAADALAAPLEHEQVLIRRGARSGLYTICAVHSTALGPSLGGLRMWHYPDSRAALRDALRLSRAMTFKSAAAGLPLGGGKAVIALTGDAPSGARRRNVLLDTADAIEALDGAYVTAEDVGTSIRDIEVIARHTRHVAGRSRRNGGSGDPSPYTALGVLAAIEASCEQAFGSPSLRGRSVVVVGLGHVGLRLARMLARRGARLTVADIDPAKRAEAQRLGALWTSPDRAMTADADVLAPCALGGVLDAASVAALRVPVVAGAANNQLAHEDVAHLLAARGVLWAPDFVANAGGIIAIAVELDPGGFDAAVARERVRGIGDTIRRLYASASDGAVTPLAAAMELARRRLVAATA